MGNIFEYETLDDVHEAYINWESEGKAIKFAWALWETAEKCVCAEPERYQFYEKLKDKIFAKLNGAGSLSKCLTEDFRRLVIRYHARGVSTTKTIELILSDESIREVTPFGFLTADGICGYENIKSFLVSRLSYLKPSHPRWPEKKFGDFWRSERASYVDQIKDIPLTQPLEQLEKLSEHYTNLEELFKNAKRTTDQERFHKCMMRTLAAIHQISRDPSIKSQQHALTQEHQTPALQQLQQEDIIEITPATAANQEA